MNMRAHQGIGLAGAVVGALVVGALANGALRAQTKPLAYVVIDISETKDAEAYIKAVSAAEPNATTSAGGRFLVRTNRPVALDGTPPNRFVIIAFDTDEKAKAWYGSQAIKEVNAVRLKTTTSRAFMVEGLTN
jgi:uncharacterized protein (DUF1330 family)